MIRKKKKTPNTLNQFKMKAIFLIIIWKKLLNYFHLHFNLLEVENVKEEDILLTQLLLTHFKLLIKIKII